MAKVDELAHKWHTKPGYGRAAFPRSDFTVEDVHAARVEFLRVMAPDPNTKAPGVCPEVLLRLREIYREHLPLIGADDAAEWRPAELRRAVDGFCIRFDLVRDGAPAEWMVDVAFDTLRWWRILEGINAEKYRDYRGWAYPGFSERPAVGAEDQELVLKFNPQWGPGPEVLHGKLDDHIARIKGQTEATGCIPQRGIPQSTDFMVAVRFQVGAERVSSIVQRNGRDRCDRRTAERKIASVLTLVGLEKRRDKAGRPPKRLKFGH